MFLKLLREVDIHDVALAGFDGFKEAETANYVNENMEHEFTREKAFQLNRDVEESIKRIGADIKLHFITDTLYKIQ